jgi:hypothetical protein
VRREDGERGGRCMLQRGAVEGIPSQGDDEVPVLGGRCLVCNLRGRAL